jgi:hypothetical protein
MQSGTLTQQGQGQVLSFFMHHVQSYGLPSYKLRLHCQQQKRNIWQFLRQLAKCSTHGIDPGNAKAGIWIASGNATSTLSGLQRQQWRRQIGYQCQEPQDAPKDSAYQHKSIITFATRFKMEPFPFIQFQQLKCLLTYSPRFAMRRSTQG